MLGVNERKDFRRASLVSELYSETHQSNAGSGPSAAIVKPGGAPNMNPGASGASGPKDGAGGSNPKPAPVRPPHYIPGMRRRVPKGKFGLIGLGKIIYLKLIRGKSLIELWVTTFLPD